MVLGMLIFPGMLNGIFSADYAIEENRTRVNIVINFIRTFVKEVI